MKPYATKREPKGTVSLTSNCPTRKRALRRDKKATRAEDRDIIQREGVAARLAQDSPNL